MRPNDGPPMRSVRSSFAPWNRDGTLININAPLRNLARQALNRNPEPSISTLDSQSVKTAENAAMMEKKGQRAQTAMLG
jgi:transposase